MADLQLTEEQCKIVHHQDGHAKVSAVAGSGKTTTMISRVAHLLEQGTTAQNILILMFNKSARDSFAAKLGELPLPSAQQLPEVRTFHALGLRLTNSFVKRGYLPQCKLLTKEFLLEKYAKASISHVLEQLEGNEEWLGKENLESFIAFIDLVKADTKPVKQVFQDLNFDERFDYFIHAFKLFEKTRKTQKIRFYADLIYDPVQAMLGDKQIANWVSDNVDHIIVDEYQDINAIQQQLLRCIAGKRADVMVVGDVDQCIYEWRGAKPEYIISRFEHDFKGAASYTLSYTFRYGHRLSLAANHLISNNKLRDDKLCISFPGTADTGIYCFEETGRHPVLSVLQKWKKGNRKLQECAVLVRMFAMAVPVELALLEAKIPYHLEGHEPVFECREIMALCGFLQLCEGGLGQGDPQTVTQTIEAMLSNPHIGLKRDKVSQLAVKISQNPEKAPSYIIAAIDKNTPYFLQEKLHDRAEAWQDIMRLSSSVKPQKLLKTIIEANELFTFYHRISTRRATAVNRINTCIAFQHFATRLDLPLSSFLQKIEQLQTANSKSHTDKLLITSIHRAKGLEWPMVIIPGLEDGIFPLLLDDQQPALDTLEDERRLFYVAMTRAIHKVVFTRPRDTVFIRENKSGSGVFPRAAHNEFTTAASRFLYESNLRLSDTLGKAIHNNDKAKSGAIEAGKIVVANRYLKAINSSIQPLQPRKKSGKTSPKKSQNRDYLHINDLAEGLMVRSAFFGPGVVTRVQDRRTGKICVLFHDHGEKILVAEIARLQAL
ncbi:MAG: hypothetical protein DSY80_04805 [Desulfocapsa sp.]|nr:MAG: hypothetical protein DSY80_04805 [Desulfocapsa sp.]